jgi:glycerol-3-phosphate dehydrogenase
MPTASRGLAQGALWQIQRLLEDPAGLGSEVAPGLHEAELRYLWDHEWARQADDVLWRRSKLGLHLGAKERAAIAGWFDDRSHATHSSVRLGAN